MPRSNTSDLASFLAAHSPLAEDATFPVGKTVSSWRVTAFLGRGGSSDVYRVENAKTAQVAALKALVFKADASDESRETARRRFVRETEFLAENAFSFFPRFYDSGETEDGRPFVVMELLESRPLPCRDRAVAAYLLKVCAAVRALHRRGLVHRDVKPGNVLFRANGDVVLVDLGLLKETAVRPGHTGVSVTLADGRAVGAGTPHYAAPEQFGGEAVSAQSDIHALGVLIDDCFGGKPPRSWNRIIRRATSSLPGQRYRDADALMCAIRWRHLPRVLFWTGVVAVAALATWWAGRAGVSPEDVAEQFRRDPKSATALREAMAAAEGYDEPDRWRALCERVVTNGVAGVVVRLNGKTHTFKRPITLENDREWFVVGPGTLDADVTGADTNAPAAVHLERCVLLNRTRKPLAKAALRYILQGQAYLNFIEQTGEEARLQTTSGFVAQFDAAFNALEFGGPATIKALNEKRRAVIDEQMHRAAENW